MSRLLDELDSQKDHEVTLGTGALLAIFLGIALVCAVFFSLGYSLGRHSAGAASAGRSTSTASKSSNPDLLTGVSGDKPSGTPAIGTPAKTAAHNQVSADPQTSPSPKTRALPLKAAPPITATGSSGQTWVQLMAAAQPEDANVLAAALRKRGYHAVVRSDTDRLYHVQIGPFTSRTEADTMRHKLQADGYNAILK